MIEVNVEDYRDLAFKHINALPLYKRKGVEEDDLLQAAYTGIFLASQAYDDTKAGLGGFVSFCYWYIQREINGLTMSQVQIDGESKLRSRVKEKLLEDVIAVDVDLDESCVLAREEDKEESLFVEEFLESLPLEGIKRNYFMDLFFLGETTASRRYMAQTGHSRNMSSLTKKKVKEIAKRHLEKLERE